MLTYLSLIIDGSEFHVTVFGKKNLLLFFPLGVCHISQRVQKYSLSSL